MLVFLVVIVLVMVVGLCKVSEYILESLVNLLCYGYYFVFIFGLIVGVILLYWVVLLVFLLMYWLVLGVVFVIVVFLIVILGLWVYFVWIICIGYIYGVLVMLIVFLLFVFFGGFVIMFGVEFNVVV